MLIGKNKLLGRFHSIEGGTDDAARIVQEIPMHMFSDSAGNGLRCISYGRAFYIHPSFSGVSPQGYQASTLPNKEQIRSQKTQPMNSFFGLLLINQFLPKVGPYPKQLRILNMTYSLPIDLRGV